MKLDWNFEGPLSVTRPTLPQKRFTGEIALPHSPMSYPLSSFTFPLYVYHLYEAKSMEICYTVGILT